MAVSISNYNTIMWLEIRFRSLKVLHMCSHAFKHLFNLHSRDPKDPVETRESLVRLEREDRRVTVDSLDCRVFLDLL